MKSKLILATALTALCLTAALIGGFVVSRSVQPQSHLGAADTNVLPLTPTTASTVYVGKDIDTTVAASSSARQYLEITNLSGATTTAQPLYCNVGNVAAPFTGFVIQSSSTKIFNLDNLPRGAVHCRYQFSTTSVGVIDF